MKRILVEFKKKEIYIPSVSSKKKGDKRRQEGGRGSCYFFLFLLDSRTSITQPLCLIWKSRMRTRTSAWTHFFLFRLVSAKERFQISYIPYSLQLINYSQRNLISILQLQRSR